MTQPALHLDLTSEAVFDHVRGSDGELVGYILITDDGDFVPFDLLHRQAADAGDLTSAEELLDGIGLSLLADTYLLQRDGRTVRVSIQELTRHEVTVSPVLGDIDAGADALDLTSRWLYPLPAPNLRSDTA